MRIFFMGGEKAGLVGLLSILAAQEEVIGVVAYDDIVRKPAEMLKIEWVTGSINSSITPPLLAQSDLLVSVHGKEIVSEELLKLPKMGGINVHPCLYKYKGANPVQRLLDDGETTASVGIHTMSSKVDEGVLQAEEFVDVSDCHSVQEVYNRLYPYYTIALYKVLRY